MGAALPAVRLLWYDEVGFIHGFAARTYSVRQCCCRSGVIRLLEADLVEALGSSNHSGASLANPCMHAHRAGYGLTTHASRHPPVPIQSSCPPKTLSAPATTNAGLGSIVVSPSGRLDEAVAIRRVDPDGGQQLLQRYNMVRAAPLLSTAPAREPSDLPCARPPPSPSPPFSWRRCRRCCSCGSGATSRFITRASTRLPCWRWRIAWPPHPPT